MAPPYLPTQLKPPLTLIQKTRVINYIKAQNYSLVDITKFIEENSGQGWLSRGAGISAPQTALDNALIQMYDIIASGGGVNVSSDITNTTEGNYIWNKYLNSATITAPGGWLYNENKALGKFLHDHNPFAPIKNVADFLKLLTEGQTWVRVGEFAAGAILLIVGFNKAFPVSTRAINGAKTGVKYAKWIE